MTVWDFEQRVMEQEGIRLIVRAPWNATVEEYGFKNRAGDSMNVKRFLEVRVHDKASPYEVAVVDGSGKNVHGRTLLKNLRASYQG